MSRSVGRWIGHRQAVIVSLAGGAEKTTRVVPDMEKHVRFSGAAHEASAEDQRDRRFAGRLQKYYGRVVSQIRDADAILIFGPGEAKGELRARLESEALGGRVTGVEGADKMTDRELAERVRRHFSPQHLQGPPA